MNTASAILNTMIHRAGSKTLLSLWLITLASGFTFVGVLIYIIRRIIETGGAICAL